MIVSVDAYMLGLRLVVPPYCFVLVLLVDCSLIFCCRCAMMPRSHKWAREQNLSSRAFAVRMPCKRAVLLISGVMCPFYFLVAAME